MLLMIDNYDSFTYNLVQYFGELGQEVTVVRNDAITVEEIGRLKPSTSIRAGMSSRRSRSGGTRMGSTLRR